MTQMVGREVVLECEQCHKPFKYKRRKSNNLKHLCEPCADMNTEESKKAFESRRRSMPSRSRVQRILDAIPIHDVNPDRILLQAFREAV
jgi:hypothetical protein